MKSPFPFFVPFLISVTIKFEKYLPDLFPGEFPRRSFAGRSWLLSTFES